MTFPRRPERARRLTRRQRLAATALVAVALLFLTIDVTGSGLRGAHGGVRGALGALYRGTDGLISPVRRFVQGVPDAGANRDTIDRLRSENAQLRARLAQDAADASASEALSRLPTTSVPARVMALGPGLGFDWTVTLDVGSHNGVQNGQTVTDGVGLVGRVLHTNAISCAVLLAADPGSGVGARDTRSTAFRRRPVGHRTGRRVDLCRRSGARDGDLGAHVRRRYDRRAGAARRVAHSP